MTKLKPCPFCGGKAILQAYSNFHTNTYGPGYEFRIKCSKCNISLEKGTYMVSMYLNENGDIGFGIDDREKAAKAWNTRYIEPEKEKSDESN